LSNGLWNSRSWISDWMFEVIYGVRHFGIATISIYIWLVTIDPGIWPTMDWHLYFGSFSFTCNSMGRYRSVAWSLQSRFPKSEITLKIFILFLSFSVFQMSCYSQNDWKQFLILPKVLLHSYYYKVPLMKLFLKRCIYYIFIIG
jgi:hypothetical protein